MENILYACLTKDPLHNNIINKHNNVNSDIHIVRAAFQKSLIWPQNSTINIAFSQNPINIPDDNTILVKATLPLFLLALLGALMTGRATSS